jgi:hypothetical protein
LQTGSLPQLFLSKPALSDEKVTKCAILSEVIRYSLTLLFDDYITDTNIFFPEKKNYMVFDHNGKKQYSALFQTWVIKTISPSSNLLFKASASSKTV